VDPDHERCDRCFLQRRVCVCAEIPRVVTRTRVVIVRFHLEQWRSSNTGRLAHLALPNSEICDHGGTKGPAQLPSLDGAWLVYPVYGDVPAPAPSAPPRQLVVLDASWSQARRMYRKLDAIRGLPILRLPDEPMPAARMRESPAPGRVSTIEAIARALRIVEGDHVARPLEQLFDLAVARVQMTGRKL
jgi:DTW domain-containing protein YfiP